MYVSIINLHKFMSIINLVTPALLSANKMIDCKHKNLNTLIEQSPNCTKIFAKTLNQVQNILNIFCFIININLHD